MSGMDEFEKGYAIARAKLRALHQTLRALNAPEQTVRDFERAAREVADYESVAHTLGVALNPPKDGVNL